MPGSVPLHAVHHVEFVVGNAKQAAYFYRKAFGFSQTAYLGPETGHRDRASYALQQGDIRLVMTTPLTPEHPLAEHHRLHGDGVRDIAFNPGFVQADDPAARFLQQDLEFADFSAVACRQDDGLNVEFPHRLLAAHEAWGNSFRISVDSSRIDFCIPMSWRMPADPSSWSWRSCSAEKGSVSAVP